MGMRINNNSCAAPALQPILDCPGGTAYDGSANYGSAPDTFCSSEDLCPADTGGQADQFMCTVADSSLPAAQAELERSQADRRAKKYEIINVPDRWKPIIQRRVQVRQMIVNEKVSTEDICTMIEYAAHAMRNGPKPVAKSGGFGGITFLQPEDGGPFDDDLCEAYLVILSHFNIHPQDSNRILMTLTHNHPAHNGVKQRNSAVLSGYPYFGGTSERQLKYVPYVSGYK